MPTSGEFLQELRKLCDQFRAVLIFDEVQAGIGRTGNFWAHQHVSYGGVEPDILSFAKPIAGGLPMGGIIVSKKISERLTPGEHGTTFGGGPLVTRVASHVIDRVNNRQV